VGVCGVAPARFLNDNGFVFGKPFWRSEKLDIYDGVAPSLGEEVIRHIFLWWLLGWCQRQVMCVSIKGFLGFDSAFILC
jgi:hypothetical protein